MTKGFALITSVIPSFGLYAYLHCLTEITISMGNTIQLIVEAWVTNHMSHFYADMIYYPIIHALRKWNLAHLCK